MDQNKSPAPPVTRAADGPSLPQIASRLLGRPLLLHPTKAEIIGHVLSGRIPLDSGGGVGQSAGLSPDANRFVGSHRRDDGTYRINAKHGSTAIITIAGSLVNRGAWIGASSGLVSYEGIGAQLRDAANDPDVERIVLDIDTPGGEAAGMFSLASLIAKVGKKKKVVAFVDDMAASAGYGIASAADEIVLSPTSVVGSIGVVLAHADYSGQMEQRGIKVTLIHAGAHKVDGHPYGPLSKDVAADLQTEVMQFYDQFVALVAAGRSRTMTDASIRATEARCYIGQEAIDRGLADRIASLDDLLLIDETPRRSAVQTKGTMMSKDNSGTPEATVFTQEQMEAARSSAHIEGRAEGRKEATERISAILTSEHAAGRADQARAMALKTSLTVEEANELLAASPKESATMSIEQRAAAEAEFGSDPVVAQRDSERTAKGWGKAVNQQNARLQST